VSDPILTRAADDVRSYRTCRGTYIETSFADVLADDVTALLAEVKRLRNERAEARLARCERVLRGLEWSGVFDLCPACDQAQSAGHSPDCPLEAALAASGEKEGKDEQVS